MTVSKAFKFLYEYFSSCADGKAEFVTVIISAALSPEKVDGFILLDSPPKNLNNIFNGGAKISKKDAQYIIDNMSLSGFERFLRSNLPSSPDRIDELESTLEGMGFAVDGDDGTIVRHCVDIFIGALKDRIHSGASDSNRVSPTDETAVVNKTAEAFLADDGPLLLEAGFKCPLCQKNLIEDIKGVSVIKYRITPIFPPQLDDLMADQFNEIYPAPVKLDSLENMIALTADCSENYLINPTPEEYKKLREIKDEISQNYKAKNDIYGVQLEDNIRIVLDALCRMDEPAELVELEYDPLYIEQKINPDDFFLKSVTKMQVLSYYRYIEKLFRESGADFESIASEVKIASRRLEKAGMDQRKVVAHLSEWIRNKSGLDMGAKPACDIVVAFFIQNCEVFYKP